jgi:hypothetical protein
VQSLHIGSEIGNLAIADPMALRLHSHDRVLEGKEVMKLATLLGEITGNHRCATPDDIRKVFGDYHNLLRWLTGFLVGDEKLADACIVDACTIAETESPDFHEWLVHWGARATVGCALQRQHANIAELASKYESEPAHRKHPALSPEYFLSLVLRGIANDSYDKVAAQLGVSRSAVEGAYCVALDALELASDGGAMQCRCSGASH